MERSNKYNDKSKQHYEDKLFNSSLQKNKKHEDQYENYYEEYEKYNKNIKSNNFSYDGYNEGAYYENKNYSSYGNRNAYYQEEKIKHGHKKNYYKDNSQYNQYENKNYDNKFSSEYSYPQNQSYHKEIKENKKYDNQYANEYSYTQNQSYPKEHKENKHNKFHNKQFKDISKIINQKENLKFYLENLSVEAPELTTNLINGLIEGSIECMICNDAIDSKKEIWECEKCFTIYHNSCIYDWIFKLNSNTTGKQISEYKWTCPHCSNNYQANADNLPIYNCYCKRFYEAKKSKDRNFNPSLIPHGCGLSCNTEVCRHVTCNLPCHPGPHLFCNIVEKVKCYCTKIEKEVSCINQNKKFSCNVVCGKTLICKRHTCKQLCHESECESFLKNKKCQECVIESKNKFYVFLKTRIQEKINSECKENLTTLADGLSEYIFHGTLFCGMHQVETNTDSNLEFILKLLQISGNKLAENIKKFVPVCKQIVENSCDCKNKMSKTECYRLYYQDDILQFLGLLDKKEKPAEKCTKVCRSFKNCKNHRCLRVCCELASKIIRNYSIDDPEGHHLCLIDCGKNLNCGVHKCEGFCHKGQCKPCPNIIREGQLLCDCKRTKIDAPYQCGTEVNCKLPCDKDSLCEHKCKLLCHKSECPPCEEITFKVCRCKKNVINGVKCGDTQVPLCSTVCGEMLPCGVHFCQLKCHEHNEEFDINYFCMMPCGREFLKCKHKCNKRCHGDDECNEVECESQIKITCKCKTFSRNIKCGEFKKLYDNDPTYTLPCVEECAKKERLKKIEQAFEELLKFSEEKNKVFSQKKPEENDKLLSTKFDYNLLEFAKKNAKFIVELETYVEKALKNQLKKFEIPKLEKKMFVPVSEFLKTYYNIEVEKIKKAGESWTTLVLSDCSQAVLPKYRLSLFCLLFKHNKFAKFPKWNIYHPFEMSINIQNFRLNILPEDIENFLLNFCSASKNDFYIDEFEKGKCYVHFFNLENGKKVFYQLKHKANQFQDASEIYYNLKDDLKLGDLYLYMRNQEYFNLLYYKDEEEKQMNEDNEGKNQEDNLPDADGFVVISKGKKPK